MSEVTQPESPVERESMHKHTHGNDSDPCSLRSSLARYTSTTLTHRPASSFRRATPLTTGSTTSTVSSSGCSGR
eukprot:326186-Prymnesium_polylepis.1